MNEGLRKLGKQALCALAGAAMVFTAFDASAQVKPVDPDKAIDGDLIPLSQQKVTPSPASATPAPSAPATASPTMTAAPVAQQDPTASPGYASAEAAARSAQNPAAKTGTYQENDLIGAAEGVFGKGAKGLAGVIKDILKKQGEPNAYIVGREGGGAIIVGLRYGSGTLYHKVEGQKPVYWTGPSIGLDAGANAGNSFVLVYNLYNTDDLYHRFGQGEGQAYLIGGFHVSYLRRGDVVLIPVRTGVGLRLGVNAGYMKMSKKAKWLPF
ncbi:MAG: EipA family protein [Novosphingobium sp.]